jgi:hypothetical protein
MSRVGVREAVTSRLLVRVVLAAFAVSIAVAIYGFSTFQLYPRSLWHPPTRILLQWIAGTALFSIGAACLALPRHARLLTVAAFLAVAISSAGLRATLACLLIFASGLALGDLFTGRTRSERPALLTATIDMALGIGVQAAILHFLGFFPINTVLFYLILLSIPVALNFRGVGRYFDVVADSLIRSAAPPRSQILFAALPCVLLFILLLFALSAEMMSDAISIYFPMADFVRRFGYWHFDVTYSNAALFSLQTVWPAIAAYVLGGSEAAAKLVNYGFLVLLAGSTYALGRTFASHRAVCVGLSLLLSTPVILVMTASFYYDNSIAALVFACFAALTYRREGASSREITISLVVLAAAVAAKITAAAAIPPVALFSLIMLWRQSRLGEAPRILLVVIPVSALVALPPYIYPYLTTGNPIFPLMNLTFQSPQFDLMNIAAFYDHLLNWDILYRMTFESGRFIEGTPGAFGFHFMIFLLPAIVLVGCLRPAIIGPLAFLGLSSFLLLAFMTVYLRYCSIAFAPFCLLIAYMLDRFRSWSGVLGAVASGIAIVVVTANGLLGPAAADAYRAADLTALWSDKARLASFKAERGQRLVPDIVNASHGARARVLFNTLGVPGIQGEMLFNAWYNFELNKDVGFAESEDGTAWAIKKHRITHVVLGAGTTPSHLSRFTEAHGELLLATGGIELWKLNENIVTGYRRDRSPQAASDLSAWKLSGESQPAREAEQALSINSDASAFFDFDAAPGLPYRFEVGLSCQAGTAGGLRLQIDWLNSRSGQLKTTSEQLPCDDRGAVQTRDVVAPAATATAQVTLRGANSVTVAVTSVKIGP